MANLWAQLPQVSQILLTLSVMLFAGFLMTRLTKLLHLPNVSAYILAGIIIGPDVLGLIPQTMVSGMSFLSDIALAFIAFGVGKFFKREVLMKTGVRVVIITMAEALLAGVLVSLVMIYLMGMDVKFSLLLGAIATATAPASTMMTIRQYHAKGEFVDVLLQVVALDDVVCLMVFSVISAILSREGEDASLVHVLTPILLNLAAIALGALCGYVLSKLLTPARSRDNRLILAIAMLLGLSGLCAVADISPLLSCMVFGAAYMNCTRDKKLYKQLNKFTPPIMSLFFILSGMNLSIGALTTFGAVGVVYFLVRIVGKYAGAYLGCRITRASERLRRYLGLALIPQAGVAIGLAFLGVRVLPAEMGQTLLTIILSSSVLYELIGPVSAKIALFRSGAIRPVNAESRAVCVTEDEGDGDESPDGSDEGDYADAGDGSANGEGEPPYDV